MTRRALVSDEFANQPVTPQRLAIDLEAEGGLLPGDWYAVHGIQGVYVSVLQPGIILRSLLTGHEASVNPLTTVESQALVYLVAFDLQSFDLHFALGPEHPRLDWSERPPGSSQDPRLPGRDRERCTAHCEWHGESLRCHANHRHVCGRLQAQPWCFQVRTAL